METKELTPAKYTHSQEIVRADTGKKEKKKEEKEKERDEEAGRGEEGEYKLGNLEPEKSGQRNDTVPVWV